MPSPRGKSCGLRLSESKRGIPNARGITADKEFLQKAAGEDVMYIYVSSETCGNTCTGSFLESIGYPDPGLEHASSDALRSPQILQVGDLVSEVGMGVAGVWLLGWLLMGSEPQANSEDERFWN